MGAARFKLATRGLQAAMGAGRQRNLYIVLLPHARVFVHPEKDTARQREGEGGRERERGTQNRRAGRAGGWEGGREGGRGGNI